MRNHFHLIISGERLTNIIQSLKRHTARKIIITAESENRKDWLEQFRKYKKSYKIKSNYQVWQEGVHPQFISSIDMLEQKMHYIHNNPVKKGYVNSPTEWIYSSARNYQEMKGILDIDELEV